ncbi:CcqE [Paramyrothecium foliicola]|nr:CcqE [Paramyrothecium foliicola]
MPASERNPEPSPIAIVGIGLRLPGGVHDAQSYWDLLVNQKDARSKIPADRFNIDGFHKDSAGNGSLSMKHGYFIDEPVDRFDAAFFSMSQAEVTRVDPQQRLLLEVMHETLENAGETDYRGRDIAVYAGSFGQDWMQMQAQDPQDGNVYSITGMDDFVLANRVSYELDLHGPSLTVKAGCSSSLIALHLACEALQRGDCSGALVGASNLLLSPTYFLALDSLGALSSAGSSNAFDANANGYARADAVNAVYVKRLDDALRDGNPIRAIVRSTAINSDGKTVGLTNPSTDAQASLIRRAYEKAGIANPGETPVVECHGTGTATGDPLEVAAVVKVFGGQETFIGSVKPNVGHGEGAAGLSSLIKAVLSLENSTIPPNIKFQTPNPKIPFDEARLVVPTQPIPWPKDRTKRISVDSFGLGGANAHVILEADTSVTNANRRLKLTGPDSGASAQRLLAFSAHSETSLTKILSNFEKYTTTESFDVNDLAYTLGARRNHQKIRAFAVTDGTTFQATSPVRSSDPKGLLFIFTGQGAQWPGMGRELIRDYASFREDIQQMDRWLAESLHPPSWTIEEVLLQAKDINSADYSQPLCTAVQVGLVNLLRTWGISPDGVVGHSSGEIGAAYAAGALDMKDAILVAFYRGVASIQQLRPGVMAAVGLGRQEVSELLVSGTTIACENSRSSVTISGDYDAVEETLERVRQARPEALARKLKVDRAYHSDHMKSVGVVYEELISTITPSPEQLSIPFYSSVTGQPIYDATQLGPSYWRANMECPVLFLSAIEAALQGAQDLGLALELGPHSALSGPFRQICKELSKSVTYYSAINRNSNATTTLLTAAGQLYTQGVTLDFAAMNPSGATLANLPPYAWTHDISYWNESRISREFRERTHPEHELLGARVTGGNDLEPSWRKLLNLKEVPYLSDHVVADDVVFPAAGYVAMAGEAIRQLSDAADFTIRSLSIGSALPLQNGRATEIITRFQPHRLTDNQDSTWYDFSIMSYDGNSWTRHCSGQIHSGNASTLSSKDAKSPVSEGKRAVVNTKWYQAAKAAGLEYGTAFQGLHDVAYNLSTGSISANLRTPDQTSTGLHPTTVDQLLQCCILGSVKGHLRNVGKLVLPVHIGELYIATGDNFDDLNCVTHTSYTSADVLAADGTIRAADGSVALQAEGLQFRILDNKRSSGDALQELRLLEWRPDIDLVDLRQLIHQTNDLSSCLELVERLNILCVLESTRILEHYDSTQHHFKRFKEWNQEYIDNIRQNGSKVVRDTDRLFDMGSEEVRAEIEVLKAEALETPARNIALAVTRIYDDVEGIFTGETEPLAVLLKDNLLMEIYNFFNMLDHEKFFKLLGHSNKTLRVVEIGAGTGGFTSTIVPALTDSSGGVLFSNYTYTDISSGFFKAAKERFAEYPGIEYTVLDISEDPAPQGLELGSYDLVVAANVLHATPDLLQTMKNCRALLRPGGRLFMLELCAEAKWVNYIMGTLPGWWLGEPDGRPNEPYIQAEQWNDILTRAGFSDVETIMDQAVPYQLDNIVIASAAEDDIIPSKTLSLLVKDTTQVAGPAEELKSKLESEGYDVSFSSLWDLPATPEDIISLLDIEGPETFFQSLTDIELRGLTRFITQNHGQKLLWLTGPAQVAVNDPHTALVLGFARTIRLELGAFFATLELDIKSDSTPWGSVVDVFNKLQTQTKKALLDTEYALVNGTVQIPRYTTRTADEVIPLAAEQVSRKLQIAKPGLLSSLQWQGETRDIPLEKGEVEIAVRASSVNYQDALLAQGAVHSNRGLGLESAGIVTRVSLSADGKSEFQVGDRVLVWSAGSLATHIRVSAQWAVKLPETLSFDEAVTLPTAYATMIRGLLEVGSLSSGDTVLIHSAADALGFAAIQISKLQGAEIFATAANEEEKQYLVTEHGIPESRIFSSQDSSFVAGITQATASRGVDIVVNSLSGELLHASWKVVAEGGNLIELSGKDIAGHGKLDLARFDGNRGFHGVDIAALISQKPSVASRLLKSSLKLYTDGLVKPVAPITRFAPNDIKQVFQQFQSGRPIGAVSLEFPEDPQDIPNDTFASEAHFRQDRSYVLIGGLGGLGKSAAVWLAERGAGSIIFMSRSATANEESEALSRELRALGSEVQIFQGSVSDATAVQALVAGASKPIAGVLHLALVLRDEALLDMTFDQWQGATEAKVQGTWNLHNALKDQPLDFFVLLSSIYGVQGNPKQANYAAASTFLDAFAQFRQNQGLPAAVIDLGVMEDIGFVSEHPAILENLRRAGAQLIRENDFLGSLQLAIRASSEKASPAPTVESAYVNRAQFVIGLGQHSPDARGLGLKVDGTTQGSDSTQAVAKEDGQVLQGFMDNAQRDPSSLADEAAVAQFLAAQVAECLKTLLIFSDSSDLNLNLGLAELGVDSLIAIELQSWWIQNFASHITILELTKSASIVELVTKRNTHNQFQIYTGTEMVQEHIGRWATPAQGHLRQDANGDNQTDYTKWRLIDNKGRQSWTYLETDEENAKWPQTIYEKYFLGLDTGLPDVPKAQTPLEAANQGASFLSQLQLPSGQWASECTGPNFLLPCVIIAWYVTGTPIPPAYATEIRRYLLSKQRTEDGGWGWHVEAQSSAIATALNYVVLRLLGASPEDPRLVKARDLLHSWGGATYAPGIGKYWLCVLGVMKWDCVNPFLPEFWLAPDSDPTAPRKWYIHTRTNFTSMSYVWSKQWSYPGDSITQQLRKELYPQAYDTIDFAAHRSNLAEVDNNYPKWWVVNLMNWLTVSVYIPYIRKRATVETAEQRVWELIKAEDENTEYIGLSPLSKAVNLIACFIHDGPDSASVKAHKATMTQYFWMTSEGMACNLSDGIQVWDTSLAIQAIAATGLEEKPKYQNAVIQAHGFLEDHQLQENVKDQEKCYRWHRKGGWPFSTKYQGYMISECTGEGLRSILQLQEISRLDLPKPLPLERLQDAVDCLLNLQNDTGGFAVYEKRQGSLNLAWLEMGEFSGKTMATYDYVECTTAVVSALAWFGKFYPKYRAEEIETVKRRGLDFIKRSQKPHGGWYGAWGVCFVYAGFFALETLALSGETYGNSAHSKKGCDFLISKQKEDGGWGESYRSFREEEYIDHEYSQVVQTAWVCLGLMYAEYPDKEPIKRGLRLIMSRQQVKGNWLQEQFEGGVGDGVISYSNYKLYWPVRALAEYAQKFGDEPL